MEQVHIYCDEQHLCELEGNLIHTSTINHFDTSGLKVFAVAQKIVLEKRSDIICLTLAVIISDLEL